ncbi:MAG TPA: helix-turn-helix transcriptional regulator [Gaiellaceae bacterium]|nr:helix-turn-helix transcriptional regulator [Gaiellaceae bacterium]
MTNAARPTARQGAAAAGRLGDRLRQLRVAAGMTQSELAGDRFSKEYVSQIERGKTRPTKETIDWLALRLGVDPGFLANGVSTDARDRVEAALARAEALLEAGEIDAAADAFADATTTVAATGAVEVEVRRLVGHGRALVIQGHVKDALALLMRARELAEGPEFSDVDRADILFRLGVCRFQLSSISTAMGLFNEALTLAERSGLPSDVLRASILDWRARCFRHQRDFAAAREDVERALELAEHLADRKTMGHLYFQASLVAERQGHMVLARSYAERAKAQYEEISDRLNLGRLLNNLGGLNFLLGKPEDAIRYLKDSVATSFDVGRDDDAARAITSLAQVHLGTGDVVLAEEHARHALSILDGRVDLLDDVGGAQLALGRALLEQDRLDEAEAALAAAEASFDQLGSASHRAAAWMAQGDLASRRGDDADASRLYRRAAEMLQDLKF